MDEAKKMAPLSGEALEQVKQKHCGVEWAFPHRLNFPDGTYTETSGMLLRDHFAAHALMHLADSDVYRAPGDVAAYCYRVADAMLAHRRGEG